ncbi:MAG TPA: alpha/beta fold hydrolase [Thermoanaerobaculia bacterium]|nr:alpha/beta fold hydrolase [Thermoanaerobaculia bacterium]
MAFRRLKLSRGLEVACLDVGPLLRASAPPLVLLHGVGADRREWYLTLPALARRRRVIAFDLLGHGLSSKPSGEGVVYRTRLLADAVVAGIEALPHPPACVDLLGHSLGGAVALDVVRRHPRLVDRLVLVDSAGLPPARSLSLLAMSLPFVPASYEDSKRLLQTSVNVKLFHHPLVVFAASRYKRRMKNRAQLMSLLAAMASGQDAMTPRDLARVRHQTLLLWGDDDRIFPLETGRALCRALPNARLEILPRCGHVAPTERPVSFVRRVEAFLKRER